MLLICHMRRSWPRNASGEGAGGGDRIHAFQPLAALRSAKERVLRRRPGRARAARPRSDKSTEQRQQEYGGANLSLTMRSVTSQEARLGRLGRTWPSPPRIGRARPKPVEVAQAFADVSRNGPKSPTDSPVSPEVGQHRSRIGPLRLILAEHT